LVKRELATFDDFRQARLGDTGFIVIEGSARAPVVHKLNGRCISPDNFKVKVMLKESTAGKYYWVDTISSAALELGASACKICKPHHPDKDIRKS
jgi:hypothetical protein